MLRALQLKMMRKAMTILMAMAMTYRKTMAKKKALKT